MTVSRISAISMLNSFNTQGVNVAKARQSFSVSTNPYQLSGENFMAKNSEYNLSRPNHKSETVANRLDYSA